MDVYKFNTAAHEQFRCDQRDIRVRRAVPLVGRGGIVLDVGCFDGTIGELFMQAGNMVYGIDASQVAVPKAVAKGIKAKLSNLEEPLDFPSEMFDVVFAGEVLEHVFNIDLLLSEIHRVLRPMGSLVATTPNLAGLGRRLFLLVNKNPHIEVSFTGSSAGHIRYFIKDTLFSILQKHGFRITNFTSDVVNFNSEGTIRSFCLARAFPTLGKSLIVKAQKC